MITTRTLCTLRDGRPVTAYKIENRYGEYAEILDYGAVIHALCVLDRDGNIGDTVLGAADAEALEGRSFKGAVMGRVGNRIAYGRCTLDGREVQLETGRGGHFLHSGSANYAFKLFSGEVVSDSAVRLTLTDHGECGFDDTVEAAITYSFDDDHRLSIHYELTPERTTVLAPTNHAYFNLGDFTDARDHVLTLFASNLAHRGESGVPEGGLDPVAGTPYDFTAPRAIREAMGDEISGYDDFYVLDRRNEDGLAAVLTSPKTGRVMRTYTDMQSVIVYTPTNCDTRPDKSGKAMPAYGAVCLECQFVPNAVNCPDYDSPVFRAGEKLDTTTVYAFGTDA